MNRPRGRRRQNALEACGPPALLSSAGTVPIATCSLVRIGILHADRARAALRPGDGSLVCRLARRAVRRTGIHSWSWAAVGSTSGLVHTSASGYACYFILHMWSRDGARAAVDRGSSRHPGRRAAIHHNSGRCSRDDVRAVWQEQTRGGTCDTTNRTRQPNLITRLYPGDPQCWCVELQYTVHALDAQSRRWRSLGLEASVATHSVSHNQEFNPHTSSINRLHNS